MTKALPICLERLKMKIAAISFNKQGDEIVETIREHLNIEIYRKQEGEEFNLTDLTGKLFKDYEAIIFVSSTGIAVRAIAPYIKSKTSDPAVIVIDSFGKYVISLLSGHLGGANSLTLKLAEILHSEPVITTATDIVGVKAPDIIAKENGLVIDDLKSAKLISAMLVNKHKVAFVDDKGQLETPEGYADSVEETSGEVYVTNKIVNDKKSNQLHLIRRDIVLGIGCRKDYPKDKMKDIVLEKLKEYGIDHRAVKIVATVEVKRNEKAIMELSENLEADLKIFTIEEIKKIQHKFKGSDFVEKTIGVRAVCEPVVELCQAKILTEKLNLDGMTLCIGEVK